jgi:hypothetical protein
MRGMVQQVVMTMLVVCLGQQHGDFEYSDIIPIRKDFESPIFIRYYDLLGKELKSEPNTGHFIQVISYKYRTEYNRVYKI